MDKYLVWFSLILGLGTFAGFVLTARALVRATPNALTELNGQLKKLIKTLNKYIESDENIKEDFDTSLTRIERLLTDLKYQHDHADNFAFGTGKTNSKLDDLEREFMKLRYKFEAHMENRNG